MEPKSQSEVGDADSNLYAEIQANETAAAAAGLPDEDQEEQGGLGKGYDTLDFYRNEHLEARDSSIAKGDPLGLRLHFDDTCATSE